MFKGSENVGTGERMLLVFNNGGQLNGTTSEDRTNYFDELPANQLELALFLEADRMRSLPTAITKENLDNQRNAVQEERRLGVDNQPYGKTQEKFQETIYDNFAYKHSVIGSMDDLNAASVEDVKDFFRYRGVFQANTEVRTNVTDGAMKELFYEIKRIRDEKAPEEEFDNAKRAIIGGFALQLESPQAILQNIITRKIYNLPADYWDIYPQKIAAITRDEVQSVARKYLDLDHLQVVAVGDGKQLVDALRKYGSVEVYDTEGKPKPATQ